MDPATLRIKFTPVIKYLQNGSKCSLEIVPELSDIQNLNKINWKDKNDLIEYVIPMTYKIILKKRRPFDSKGATDQLNKIYHSCVDLLGSSPVTNRNLASVDVQRIISDTYIISKMSGDVSGLVLASTTEKCNSIITIQDMKTSNTHLSKGNDSNYFKHDNFNSSLIIQTYELKAGTANKELLCENVFSKTSIDKKNISNKRVDNVKNNWKLHTGALGQFIEPLNKSTSMTNAPNKLMYRLNLTPVCIVNTAEAVEAISKNLSEYMIEKQIRLDSNLIHFRDSIKGKDFGERHVIYRTNLGKRICAEEIKCLQNIWINKRILPEVRVTKFVKFMEEELMPVKIMLHQILHKCSILGITKPKLTYDNYSSIECNNENNKQNVKCPKQQTSNRFVYTFVFQE